MIEYLSREEANYLGRVVRGEHGADFWSEDARRRLAEKLERLERWAMKEDEARERLRQG